ncbi:MAG: vWA domain-containing protein [Verrucomicrobiota bacterium]
MKSVALNLTGLLAFLASGFVAVGQESGVESVKLSDSKKSPAAPAVDAAQKSSGTAPQPEAPVVQLALLLDTSGSMKGLIDQAKTQLWGVVNEFITAKQAGKTPVVQVALYEYGKSSLKKEEHWVRQIQPLTRDLDKISEELFALRTNGGEEYCGAVISAAAGSLDWDSSSKTYKAIFIAGNEPFTQGPVASGGACKEAITKGIIVNTIHCGPESEGVRTGWKDGALMADGSYMTIDQNQAVAHIDAPQDKEIVRLNEELNRTYVGWGVNARGAAANQEAQDSNAKGIAFSNLVSRARTKASSNYFNASWDLVDACRAPDFKWDSIKKEDLPDDLKKLTTAELKAHVDAQLACRKDIQKKILALTTERSTYVAAKRKELGEDLSLGNAVAGTVRKQAATKGVTFETGK